MTHGSDRLAVEQVLQRAAQPVAHRGRLRARLCGLQRRRPRRAPLRSKANSFSLKRSVPSCTSDTISPVAGSSSCG